MALSNSTLPVTNYISYTWYKSLIGRTYELRKTIDSGGCGTVFNGRIQSTSKSIMSRNAKKRVFTFDNNFLRRYLTQKSNSMKGLKSAMLG